MKDLKMSFFRERTIFSWSLLSIIFCFVPFRLVVFNFDKARFSRWKCSHRGNCEFCGAGGLDLFDQNIGRSTYTPFNKHKKYQEVLGFIFCTFLLCVVKDLLLDTPDNCTVLATRGAITSAWQKMEENSWFLKDGQPLILYEFSFKNRIRGYVLFHLWIISHLFFRRWLCMCVWKVVTVSKKV